MIIDVPDEVVQKIYDIAHTGEELPVGIQAILVRLITEKGRTISNDLKFHGIEWLGSIKDMCLNNEDCKECSYSEKNYNCLIYEVTSTFPDNWVIDTIGKEGEKMPKLIFNGQEIADVNYTGGQVEPTSNLWGGLQMAIDIIKAGLSSAGAAADYVSLTGSYTMNNRVAVDDIFEANKQYTFILAYENNSTYSGGSVTANLLFRYSDNSYDTFTITGGVANTKYTRAFVSAEGKTVTSIQCTYNWETAKLYYDESGVFEGVKTVEDFEPYNRYNE